MMIRERTVASLYVPGEAMLIKNKEGVRWVGQVLGTSAACSECSKDFRDGSWLGVKRWVCFSCAG